MENNNNMSILSSNKEKWYNMEMLVDFMLFAFPPLGWYAIYKTTKIKTNTFKILYSLFGAISLYTGIVYLIKL